MMPSCIMRFGAGKPMAKIFVSYRRADNAAGYAMDLARILRESFGERHIFRDTRSIPPGVDFGAFIKRMLESCTVMLVVIGRHWASETTEDGRPRLLEPNDWVRLEVATALHTPHVRVIPVLVGGAALPRTDQLPPDLQPLISRNAVVLEDKKWESDVAALITDLEQVPGLLPWWRRLRRRRDRYPQRSSGVRRKMPVLVAAGLAAAAMLVAVLVALNAEFDRLMANNGLPFPELAANAWQPHLEKGAMGAAVDRGNRESRDRSALLRSGSTRLVGRQPAIAVDLSGVWRDGNGNQYLLQQMRERVSISPISGIYAGIGEGRGRFDGRSLSFDFAIGGQPRWSGSALLMPDNQTLLGQVRDRFTGLSEELYLSRF